jgi:hypothetical protein
MMDQSQSGESFTISSSHFSGDQEFKNVPLNKLFKMDSGVSRDIEANSAGTDIATSGCAQAGVKNIEAISMIWTKWGLIAAYVRLVWPLNQHIK